MQLHIAVAGRLREPYWIAACDEYRKRLCRFCRLAETEVGDTEAPLPPRGFTAVALCVEGEMLSSEAFADRFRLWQTGGTSRVAFLIGGSDGLPQKTKSDSDFLLSLSRMTFPHHMARALLLEQIYRAFMILEGAKYHK